MTLSRLYILAAVAAAMLSIPNDARAQQPASGTRLTPPIVATLDMRAVTRDSAAGKSIQSYVNARRKIQKDRIAKEEQSLRAAWDELSRQRSILSPQAFQQREREFRTKEASAKRNIAQGEQELQRELRATLTEARRLVDSTLRPILDKLIAAKGIDIIVASQDLIYTSAKYDLTKQVLRELDKKLPRLDVKALAAKAKAKQNRKKK